MTLTLDKPQAETALFESVARPEGTREHLWTVDALYRAIDAGVFAHPERLELIQGRIFENMSQGPRHSTLATEVAEMLREALKRQFAIREEKPIRIGVDGEPIPDILVLRGQQANYSERQPVPEDVALLVEVSDTTVLYDLGGKARMYAQSGIVEYWVVLVKENALVRHREPTPNGYQNVVRLAGDETISLLAAPESIWTISTLFGREEAREEN